MHHDDKAPTSPKTAPRTSKTPSKASRPIKKAKNPPKVAKRVSAVKKKAVPKPKYKKKSPHLIKRDAQRVAARKAAEREEMMMDGGPIPQGKTILLSEMAEFLNDYFSKKEPLNDFTPYDWWRRHKTGTLSTPLPTPVRMIGSGPLFLATDIVKWYKVYVSNKGRWDTGT
jgi:hypothetical protein